MISSYERWVGILENEAHDLCVRRRLIVDHKWRCFRKNHLCEHCEVNRGRSVACRIIMPNQGSSRTHRRSSTSVSWTVHTARDFQGWCNKAPSVKGSTLIAVLRRATSTPPCTLYFGRFPFVGVLEYRWRLGITVGIRAFPMMLPCSRYINLRLPELYLRTKECDAKNSPHLQGQAGTGVQNR